LKKHLLNVVIFSLVFFGILLMSQNFIQSRLVYHATRVNVEINPEQFADNLEADAVFDFEGIESIDLLVILDAMREDVSPIGEIIIPSVDIHLPVLLGTDNATMSLGAGTMRPDQVMGEGNYPLASHRMNDPAQLFTPLQNVEVGERIFLRDASYIYMYEITAWEIISQYSIDVIEDVEGQTLITLITCTEENDENRIMVRGEFYDTVAVDELLELIDDDELLDVFGMIAQPGEGTSGLRVWLEIGGIVLGAALAGFLATRIGSGRKKSNRPELEIQNAELRDDDSSSQHEEGAQNLTNEHDQDVSDEE